MLVVCTNQFLFARDQRSSFTVRIDFSVKPTTVLIFTQFASTKKELIEAMLSTNADTCKEVVDKADICLPGEIDVEKTIGMKHCRTLVIESLALFVLPTSPRALSLVLIISEEWTRTPLPDCFGFC